MNELSLFSGAGGGILGGILLGWRTVCAVEIDPYAASVLLARQNDGILPPFPVWDDIRTFDGKPWRGIVGVVSGGFPCQDISCAGKGIGIDGERSGLWREMARVVREVQPEFVFVENSPMLTIRGIYVVLGDLAAMGYYAEWGVLGADNAGAPHIRKRIWILAHAKHYARRPEQRSEPRQWDLQSPTQNAMSERGGDDVENPNRRGLSESSICSEQQGRTEIISAGESVPDSSLGGQPIVRRASGQYGHIDELHKDVPDANQSGRHGRSRGTSGGRKEPTLIYGNPNEPGLSLGQGESGDDGKEQSSVIGTDWWLSEPRMGGLAHGMAVGVGQFETDAEGNLCRVAKGIPARVDRLKALGNGQVPACAALAWKILYERIVDEIPSP